MSRYIPASNSRGSFVVASEDAANAEKKRIQYSNARKHSSIVAVQHQHSSNTAA
jgi:hypothetical protein